MSTKKSAEERAEARFPYDIDRLTLNQGSINRAQELKRDGYATCIREEVEPLESKNVSLTEENAKLRALVQRLVDALGHIEVPRNLLTDKVKAAILAIDAAKEHGFVPTNTQDQ